MTLLFILALIPGVAVCLSCLGPTAKPNNGMLQFMFLASAVALFFAPLLVIGYWAASWLLGLVWFALSHSIRAQSSACKYPQ